MLNERTIAFADFVGNRQYITQGNLTDKSKAHLFLTDYRRRRRVKIWATARVVDGDADTLRSMLPAGYKARGEQVTRLRGVSPIGSARNSR